MGGDYLPSDPEPPVTVRKYTMLLFFYRLCEADGTYEVNFAYFKSDALIQHTNTVKLCHICYILTDSWYLWVWQREVKKKKQTTTTKYM